MKRLPILVLVSAFTCVFNPSFANPPTDTGKVIVVPQQIVNINEANVESLISLKGIGSKKAQEIINYRESIGKFKSIDDLLNIKGIGVKIISDNEGRLKV